MFGSSLFIFLFFTWSPTFITHLAVNVQWMPICRKTQGRLYTRTAPTLGNIIWGWGWNYPSWHVTFGSWSYFWLAEKQRGWRCSLTWTETATCLYWRNWSERWSFCRTTRRSLCRKRTGMRWSRYASPQYSLYWTSPQTLPVVAVSASHAGHMLCKTLPYSNGYIHEYILTHRISLDMWKYLVVLTSVLQCS